MSGAPLARKRVLVTRPREQATPLSALILEAGGEPILFPAIEILNPTDPNRFHGIADRLEQFHLAIFISPTAVQKAFELLQARHPGRRWPDHLRVAAIGSGSARELERQGFKSVIVPAGEADSEALLRSRELGDVHAKSIVIFRGEGGRELLGDSLAARGARVEYAECYRRARPAVSATEPAWARDVLDAVTVSSSEGLANLDAMLRAWRRDWLRESPLFVPHARVAEEAARLGASETIVAGAGDSETACALIAYFRGAK
jgi:uroporphyrinogen-III synthase